MNPKIEKKTFAISWVKPRLDSFGMYVGKGKEWGVLGEQALHTFLCFTGELYLFCMTSKLNSLSLIIESKN